MFDINIIYLLKNPIFINHLNQTNISYVRRN